jgi:hypothetical protein
VEDAVVAKKFVEVAFVVVERVMLLKILAPEKRLLSPRRVEEAAVAPPQPTQEATVSMPMFAEAAKRLEEDAVVEKKLVEVAFPKTVAPVKVLVPLKVLLFARRVELAAVMVMLEVPSNEVPLIVLAF